LADLVKGPRKLPAVLLAAVLLATGAGAFIGTGAAGAAEPSVPSACPSAAEVGAALGLTVSPPAVVRHAVYLGCKYPAKENGFQNIIQPTVTIMRDPQSAFDLAEKQAVSMEGAVRVSGLGTAAYEVTYGLFVLEGKGDNAVCYEVAAMVSDSHLQALMRKLL
jgi:hypothetical protein